MIYTFLVWVFFFYFYCFLGWVWETLYVSVCQAKWVNRGFMHGPFLPIYGTGAIIVLIFTLPFRTQMIAVFFAGMISATILEYFTGVAMEKLFHVRYWDYTGKPFNINGHICLKSSFAWGVFSVILTMYGHQYVEKMALGMNQNLIEIIVIVLTIVISIDMSESVREALNLKELLMNLEQNNEDFRHMQKHMEVLAAFYGGEIKEKSEIGLKKINMAFTTGKEVYDKVGETGKRYKNKSKAMFIEKLESTKAIKDEAFDKIISLMDMMEERKHILQISDEKQRNLIIEEIKAVREHISKLYKNPYGLKKLDYLRMQSLLKRNPHAISKMHEKAFEDVIELTEESGKYSSKNSQK